jgi:hypothetical protein
MIPGRIDGSMRLLGTLAMALQVAACGAAAAPAPGARFSGPFAVPDPAEPAGSETELDGDQGVVPPPPPECSAYVERKPRVPAGACDDRTGALLALDASLGQSDVHDRDALLIALESCRGLSAGLVRALRADLAPTVCADALVVPALSKPTEQGPMKETLQGLAIAGRLARLVQNPPKLEPPFDQPRLSEFLESRLKPWIRTQAAAIQALSLKAAQLGGYGKAIATIEAGLADMRFVEVVRDVPLPNELERDEELKELYFSGLDRAIDPRKDRGRNAALFGLAELAAAGVLRDPRGDRARRLLSKLYAERRIDALDGLLLPPLLAVDHGSVELRLAARLPTFYAGIVLTDANNYRLRMKPGDAPLLRALLERGIPPQMRVRLDASELSPELRELYARAFFEFGQRYWRSQDFLSAAFQLERARARKPPSGTMRLLSGLATALRGGPEDAAEMIRRGPFLAKGIGAVAELDALGVASGPIAGMAAYDAGYILSLVPPRAPDPAFWMQVSARFRRASKLLGDPVQKRWADERAIAAEDKAALR